jgi:sterol desaturase/sphingolipid hydroxylase (fatty acid hydroxylase superfamily)
MPLTDLIPPALIEILRWTYWQIVNPLVAQPTFSWMFFLSTLVAAYLFYFFIASRVQDPSTRRGFLRYVFPREVWGHRSAIVDYKFFVASILLIKYLQLGQWVLGLAAILKVAEGIQWVLDQTLGTVPAAGGPPAGVVVSFTLLTALAYDYGRFLSHFVQHRVPVLWEFHKVHHSAEVLTPISSFRAHPIDQMIEFLFRLIGTAVVSGVFAHFYATGIAELTVLNYSALTFVYYLTAHLRHSHIPVGFGRFSTVMVSPVMHQLHHSANPDHFDKNFGFIFSFWDRMAGTYLIPARNERFTLGLPPEAGKYDTATALFLYPFQGAARILFRRPRTIKPAEKG